jgi:23S rRNA (cytosine1962-C5)-methyltransferase
MHPFEQRRILYLRRDRARVVAKRHPWIFAGAIQSEAGPEDAAIADLVDASGQVVASGFYSSKSQIRLRALTFDGTPVSAGLIEERLRAAIERRRGILDEGTNAARLVHSEGDDLSGMVVDLYGGVAVIEIANRGAAQLQDLLVGLVRELAGVGVVHLRNDIPARRIEGLTLQSITIGAESPSTGIRESGLRFEVDPSEGQKTGFFLDQRENRRMARELASGARVLNLFSYSGGFGVYAAAGGAAQVTNVDVSPRAVELAERNHALNGSEAEQVVADAFGYVRQERRTFDLIVCDPPAFAKSRGEVERAARGYKDINLHALRLAAPGARMLTFSCSGHMSLDLFQKVVFAAALDAGRRVSFVRRLTAGPDHPVSIYCPEGEYLKGFLLEVW